MAEAAEEPGIATMGKRGQVVIPKEIREKLGLPERARFVVYGRGDVIVLKRLELPDIEDEWEEIFEAVDEKDLGLSDADVREEVEAARRDPGDGGSD